MDQVNGAVLLLVPQMPMLNWARSVYTGEVELTLESMQEHSTAIYLNRLWKRFTVEAFLEEHHMDILQHEFSIWTKDERLWPSFSPQLLNEWFKPKLLLPLYRVD